MKDVAVDACCLINLLAAGSILPAPPPPAARRKASKPKRASHALEATLHVPAAVAQETYYLLQPDKDDQQKLVKVPVDLEPHFERGVLMECDVAGAEETDLFVQFASRLDDGEAACLAIAKSRGWTLATDDRPATNLAGQVGAPVVTTAQLISPRRSSSQSGQRRPKSTRPKSPAHSRTSRLSPSSCLGRVHRGRPGGIRTSQRNERRQASR